uniref:Dynein axonemal assembly factor 1 homolog n=1 Tax=Anopheles atroparvus TaxID=41427 RepID=A0A182J261_ANOAO
MSTPKIRGKSAIHINDSIIGTNGASGGGGGGGVGVGQHNALLKIESVVPKLTNRGTNAVVLAAGHSSRLRTFHRSHSTLSSSYLKKVSAAAAVSDHHRQQRIFAPRPEPIAERGLPVPSYEPPVVDGTAQLTETPPLADSTLIVQNGVSSIRRSQKDREKHPDRVNLDRKGLSSIPIIEEEPNLRLLSLQHNLINSFHIPPDAADPNNNLQPATAPLTGSHCVVNGGELKPAPTAIHSANSPPTPTKPSPASTPTNGPTGPSVTTHNGSYGAGTITTASGKSVKQFLRQKSTSRGQLLMGQNLATLGTAGSVGGPSAGFIQSKMTIGSKQVGSQVNQPSQTLPGMPGSSVPLTVSPHLQKSSAHGSPNAPIAITAQQKSLLKKSNSFIGGPSMFLTGGGAGQPPTTAGGANGLLKMRAGKLLLVPSFSIDNLSNISEIPHGEQEYFNGHSSSNGSAGNSGKTTPTNGHATMGTTTPLSESVPMACGMLGTRYNLSNLVFLDLYDNQIEKISCLDGLKSLTVLLLGKNRITDIGGLVSLKSTLRVLDLHGNKISNITGKINQLQELKSLNLAGNALRQIQAQDFAGLFSLKELNLKRNRIKKMGGFDDLHNLERLWLCHNDLQCVEDMSAIAKAINLKEVTIENNPVSLAGDCVSFLVSYLPGLVSLSQMQITEQVRRAASAWRKNKELSDSKYSNLTSDVCQSIRREEIISNARTNWELLRSQQSTVIARGAQRMGVATNGVAGKDGMELDVAGNVPAENGTPPAAGKLSRKGNNAGAVTNGAVQTNGSRPLKGRKTATRKLVRSSSQDNSGSQLSEQGGEEYFRLPPILAPFLDQSTATKVEGECAVTSGVAAQGDSSVSSGFSSDNEEQLNPKDLDKELEKETTMVACSASSTPEKEPEIPPLPVTEVMEEDPIARHMLPAPNDPPAKELTVSNLEESSVKLPPPLPPDDRPPEILPDAACLEKLSTLSTISTKSAAESVITNASSNSDSTGSTTDSTGSGPSGPSGSGAPVGASGRTHKTKLNTSHKRYGTGTLARTQTSRNAALVSGHVTSLANSSNLATPGTGQGNPLSTGGTTNGAYSGIASSNYGPPVPSGGGKSGKSGEREREQGGDYLIEICGRYLNVYGLGALRFIDKQWNMQKACDVHTVKFSYINFNSITAILCRIKVRFVNAENFIFRETNITCLGQINALAESQGIASLTIDPEGNPLAAKPWRSYAIYRLSHWGLKQVNAIEVTAEEVQTAEAVYAGLSDLVLWSLPEGLLQPLLQRLRLEETAHASKMTAKEWLMQADPSLKNIVGKEALQWKKHSTTQDDTVMRAKGKAYFGKMLENTCNAVEKLQRLETMWPSLLLEMIRNTLIDYSQIDVYVKGMLVDLLK